VAKEVGEASREVSTTLWQLLIKVIVAHLDQESSAKSAAEAVLVALSVPKRKDILSTARKSLAGSEISIKGIQQFYTQVQGIDKRAELAIRQRCLWVLLESIANNFDERKTSKQDALAFCLLVLSGKDLSRLDDGDCELLKKCSNQSANKKLERGAESPHCYRYARTRHLGRSFQESSSPCDSSTLKECSHTGRSISLVFDRSGGGSSPWGHP
jgi:hypothetical protein